MVQRPRGRYCSRRARSHLASAGSTWASEPCRDATPWGGGGPARYAVPGPPPSNPFPGAPRKSVGLKIPYSTRHCFCTILQPSAWSPANKTELKAGTKVIIFGAVKKDDGTLEANRVNVGRDGITPPM